MKKSFIFIFSFCVFHFDFAFAQYAPPVGQLGTTAIYKDSLIIKSWADKCWIYRGSIDISHPENGFATAGIPSNALGKADNSTVSLGDGGYAIYKIDPPLRNGVGLDFAVFENSFNNDFLELAFVEVSSDSINFIRFPSVSLTSSATQTASFGLTDAAKINNLAGKYRGMYGTPFDLDELKGNTFLQVDSVRYIKIIDVVGSVMNQYASYDSQGNIINDPWPTAFESSGFDLDALGMMNQISNDVPIQNVNNEFNVYPIPVHDFLKINLHGVVKQIALYEISGKLVKYFDIFISGTLNLSDVNAGVYFLQVVTETDIYIKKIFK